MRHVIKTAPPPSFVAWLDAQKAAGLELSWSALASEPKRELHARVLDDQGFVCCYCEQAVTVETSHLEHLVPGEKASDPGALDFANLYASCGRTGDPQRRYDPGHCGIFRGDEHLRVSPALPEIRSYFTFQPNGRMFARHTKPPKERNDAARAIRTLNLDEPYDLRAMRAKVIGEVLDYLRLKPDEDPREISRRIDARLGDRVRPACSAMVYVLELASRRWRPRENAG